jgi:hypothetical protein
MRRTGTDNTDETCAQAENTVISGIQAEPPSRSDKLLFKMIVPIFQMRFLTVLYSHAAYEKSSDSLLEVFSF